MNECTIPQYKETISLKISNGEFLGMYTIQKEFLQKQVSFDCLKTFKNGQT